MSPIVPPYQSSFDLAIPVVLQHEGGYVDNPVDPGGETNFGISMLMVRHEKISAADLGLPNLEHGCMKLLSLDKAKEIYRRFFWDKFAYSRLVDQNVATKVFDCAVNCGPTRAHQLAQRAAGVLDDGILGPQTVAAVNQVSPPLFVRSLAAQMEHYYRGIVQAHPSQAVFLSNWLKRAAWGVPHAV